jgi:O-antigen/teichoic acid export membrane protein
MSPSRDPSTVSNHSGVERALAQNVLTTAKGSGFLAGGTFFEFASRFGIAIVVARALGTTDYGLYILAVSAASLFAGVSLIGLDDAMVRYVAIMSGRDDRRGVWGTLQIGFVIGGAGGLVMGAALFFAAGPLANGLFHAPTLAPLLRLLSIVVPFLTLSNLLLGATRGFGRMDYAAFSEKVVQSVVRLVLLVPLAVFGKLHLVAAVVVFGIADVASSVALIALLNRVFPITQPRGQDARRDSRAVMRFAFPLWISGLLRQFRRNIENLMVGVISTVANVGIFSVVGKINLVSNVSSQSIYIAVRPVLARLHDRGDRTGLEHLYVTSTRWTFALNIPFFLITILYARPILMLFGPDYEAGAVALVIVAFGQFANAATGICQPMLDMTGHVRAKLANTVLWTVLLIGGDALLIPRWDIAGAAVASLVAISAVNILCVVEVWVLERLSPFDRTFLKPLAAGLAAFIAGVALLHAKPVGGSLVMAAIEGLLVGAVYGGVLLALGLAPEDRLVFERIARKIGISRPVLEGRSA